MSHHARGSARLMGIAILRHVVSSAVGFAIVPLVAHLLGAEALGAWALLGTTAFALGVSDLGLGAAVQRAAARREDDLARSLVGTSLSFVAAIAVPLAILGRVFVLDLPGDAQTADALALAAWPTLAAGVVAASGVPFRAWLVGRGQLGALTRARSVAAGVQLALTTGGLLWITHLAVVGAALLTAALIEVALCARAARRLDGALPLGPRRPPSWEQTRDALGHGSAALAVSIGALAAARLDLALLAHAAPVLAVAAYAVASRAVDQSFTVVKQISTALLPRLAHASTRDDAIATGTRALGGVVAAGMVALFGPGRELLTLWAGDVAHHPDMGVALLLLGIAATISASHETVASALTLGGRSSWDAARPLVVGYAINFAISALFVGRFGIWAVATGTVVGNAVTSVWLWSAARAHFGWVFSRSWRALAPVALSGVVASAIAWPLSLFAREAWSGLLASGLTVVIGAGSGHLGARRWR